MYNTNANKIRALLAQVHVVENEDAQVVLDFVRNVIPQIIRVYKSQASVNSLLQNKIRNLTGKVDKLEIYSQTNRADPVEEAKVKMEMTTPLADDDETIDTDAALADLKEAVAESKPKKTKRTRKTSDPLANLR